MRNRLAFFGCRDHLLQRTAAKKNIPSDDRFRFAHAAATAT